ANNNSEPTFVGPTYSGLRDYPATPNNVNGAIKCQQISGGDGYATMGDGTQTYMFSFGPLSGLAKIAAGQPGTDFPSEFNQPYSGPMLQPGEPATTDDPNQNRSINLGSFTYNGAIGLVPDLDANRSFSAFLIFEAAPPSHTVTALAINPPVSVGSTVVVS